MEGTRDEATLRTGRVTEYGKKHQTSLGRDEGLGRLNSDDTDMGQAEKEPDEINTGGTLSCLQLSTSGTSIIPMVSLHQVSLRYQIHPHQPRLPLQLPGRRLRCFDP